MDTPWFEIRDKLPEGAVVALSANFGLYGDMSNRLMSIAAGLGLEQEIYSIEESFINLAGVRDVTRRAVHVRSRIHTWIGSRELLPTAQTRAHPTSHLYDPQRRARERYPARL